MVLVVVVGKAPSMRVAVAVSHWPAKESAAVSDQLAWPAGLVVMLMEPRKFCPLAVAAVAADYLDLKFNAKDLTALPLELVTEAKQPAT